MPTLVMLSPMQGKPYKLFELAFEDVISCSLAQYNDENIENQYFIYIEF